MLVQILFSYVLLSIFTEQLNSLVLFLRIRHAYTD